MVQHTEKRLLEYAGLFLFINSIIFTLSPAVRERTWETQYRFSHWGGFFIWVLFAFSTHQMLNKRLSERDPYLFPAAAFLTGWGLLTIWRLDETFGMRQTLWLIAAAFLMMTLLQFNNSLHILRRYKYILLAGGILLTGVTLLLGTNPLGYGPKLWLGCCGIYFQPSEPLKLLLVSYLAAYLADRTQLKLSALPLLVPTLAVTGFSFLILVVQRDLGTASIFVLLFTAMLFSATNKKRILFAAAFMLGMALVIGYFAVDVIHLRVAGWLNPWADPSGNSYQIVQSILAVANGGLLGRGLGNGSPLLVPVAISDFIFAAIVEEHGLIGAAGLIGALWVILSRGMLAALRASDRFKRHLAAGIVAYLGIQSLLIIGGNLRLLPLTGVTLPFISYGGSSLLTSIFSIYLLLFISNHEEEEPASLSSADTYSILSGMIALGLIASFIASAWWAVIRAPDLLTRTDNARRSIADRYVPRGNLLDRNNQVITITIGKSGSYIRDYVYPDLAPITGYTHPVFGQAGLEGSLDEYLRGLQGNPSLSIWWNQLLYGTPPAGLDVRLSIDLTLQTRADELLGDHKGAIILMNAQTGEILVMASHPVYNPNNLDAEGQILVQDPNAPLINRATQGLYYAGTSITPLTQTRFGDTQPTDAQLLQFYESLGFYRAPQINMPVSIDGQKDAPLKISPLQLTLAAAALSNHGLMPSPRIALAVNTPTQGWVALSALGTPVRVYQATAADEAAFSFLIEGKPYWSYTGKSSDGKSFTTWLTAGTLPDWGGTPLTMVIALEENNQTLIESIRDELFSAAIR